jgi:hypothetical protein
MRQETEQKSQNRLMSQGNEARNPDRGGDSSVSATAFDRLMERTFGKSNKVSNIAITCGITAFLAALALFALCRTIGGSWVDKYGIACLNVMFISGAIAFSARKISQVVRVLSGLVARIKGQKAPEFKEEEHYYSKLVKKAFKTTMTKGTDFIRPLKTRACGRASRIIVRVQCNARAYRSARRPAFAHSSLDGGGGGGSGDDSGDSDQGDPPGPSHHTAQPLKLSQTFYRKPNSLSLPLRSRASGCWRMNRHEISSLGRCPA